MANPSKFEPNILILYSHWKEKIYNSKQSSFLFNSLFIMVFWIWKFCHHLGSTVELSKWMNILMLLGVMDLTTQVSKKCVMRKARKDSVVLD